MLGKFQNYREKEKKYESLREKSERIQICVSCLMIKSMCIFLFLRKYEKVGRKNQKEAKELRRKVGSYESTQVHLAPAGTP